MTVRNSIPQYERYGEPVDPHGPLNFNIQRIETFLAASGTYHHAHRHPGLYQLVWVQKGKGKHRIDLQEFKMKPGRFFALHPGIVHDCVSDRDMEGFILHFSPAFLWPEGVAPKTTALGGTDYYSILEVPQEMEVSLQTLFEQMLEEVQARKLGHETLIRSLIQVLLVYKSRWPVVASSNFSAANRLHADFDQLLSRWYNKERMVQAYADALQVSVPILNQTIKAFTGASASTQIQRRIILEAKRQLTYTRQNISEIAYALGFEDPNYFWKYFKRHTGLTPGFFRRKVQNGRK